MKRNLLIGLGLLIVIIGILMWWFSAAQVIKRQTEKLASSLTIAKTDGKSARALKNQDFSGLLAPSASCSVDIADYQSDYRHDDLVAAHHMLAHNCDSSSAMISNLELTKMNDSSIKVTADLNLVVTEKSGNHHGEACQATLLWSKNEAGGWKLESIEIKSP